MSESYGDLKSAIARRREEYRPADPLNETTAEKLSYFHPAANPETYQPEHHDGQQMDYHRAAAENRTANFKLAFRDQLRENYPDIARDLNHRQDIYAKDPEEHNKYVSAIKSAFSNVEFPNRRIAREAAEDIARAAYQPTHQSLDCLETRIAGEETLQQYNRAREQVEDLERKLTQDLYQHAASQLDYRHRSLIAEELTRETGMKYEPGTEKPEYPEPRKYNTGPERLAYSTAATIFAERAFNQDIDWGKTYLHDQNLISQHSREFREFENKFTFHKGFVDLRQAGTEIADQYHRMQDELNKPFGTIDWANVRQDLTELRDHQALDQLTCETALAYAENSETLAGMYPDRPGDPGAVEKDYFIAGIKFLTEENRGFTRPPIDRESRNAGY